METLLNLMAFTLASGLWIMAFAGLRSGLKNIIRAYENEEREIRDQFRGSPVNSATTQYSPAA